MVSRHDSHTYLLAIRHGDFDLRRHFGLWALALCHFGGISAMESIFTPWPSAGNQFGRIIPPFGVSIYLLGPRHYPTTGAQR